jgi:signal transduction histidine kinase
MTSSNNDSLQIPVEFEIGWLYQPKYKPIRAAIQEYSSCHRSFAAEIILLLLMLLRDLLICFSRRYSSSQTITIVYSVLIANNAIKLIFGFCYVAENYAVSIAKTTTWLTPYRASLSFMFSISWCLSSSLLFIEKCFLAHPCPTNVEVEFSAPDCLLPIEIDEIPICAAVLLVTVPVLSVSVFRQTNFILMIILSLMSLGTIFVGVVWKISTLTQNSINIALYMAIFQLVVVNDIMRQTISRFQLNHRLERTLHENALLRDEERKTDARHLIANVAHDLKTPLSSFMVGLDLVSTMVADLQQTICKVTESAVRQDLNVTIASITSSIDDVSNTNTFMIMAINRCLDYAKASKGLNLQPKNDSTNLLDAIQMPVKCMKNVKPDMQISTNVVAASICTYVITDKQWLQENILCLLSNAAKYSSGSVSLEVSLIGANIESSTVHPDPASVASRFNAVSKIAPISQSMLHFIVEDSGIGVPKEVADNLFNAFSQGQRLAGGTGLGLYSLAKRVDALGGAYGVENRRDGGQGALFWFSIPYRPDAEIAAAMLQRKDSLKYDTEETTVSVSRLTLTVPKSPKSVPRSPKSVPISPRSVLPHECWNILVAEDAPSIMKLLSATLRRNGHRVVEAVNGYEALQLIEYSILHSSVADKPQIILMDLQMPIMDGLEVRTCNKSTVLCLNSCLCTYFTVDKENSCV